MPSVGTVPVRRTVLSILALGALLVPASSVSAQVGVGARIAWVTSDSDLDVDSVRFYGGQIRFLSQRYGLKVAVDRHSEDFDLLNRKITETPIQASLLLRLGSGRFAPFLLGGPGWYHRSVEVEVIDDADVDVDETEFGWHAGGGLEVLFGRHLGIHGDYRYTFLGDDDDDDDDDDGPGFIGGLLPGHRGSMWTLGATFYF